MDGFAGGMISKRLLLSTGRIGIVFSICLIAACSNTAPTSTPMIGELTLVSRQGGGYLYGDPNGRFTLPLVGDWKPFETDGSFAAFSLPDPALEFSVVTVESEENKEGVEAALTQIGVDTSTLSLLAAIPDPRWSLYAYAAEDGLGLSIAAWTLESEIVAAIFTGDLRDTTEPPAQVWATLEGFCRMSLEEYLEFNPPPTPSTVAEIENLNSIEFYSGRTKLVGRLDLPDGEGPFPAIVAVHGSGQKTRLGTGYVSSLEMLEAGIAVFYYDKRGVGDSEGHFVEVGVQTDGWRIGQLANDVLAAVAFLEGLEEINSDQIGLMGGSQAGWIIPLAASRSASLAFSVIVSGATVSVGEEIYFSELTQDAGKLQEMNQAELEGMSEALAAFGGELGFDPRKSIEAMTIPGLWIWGGRDGSIPIRESRAILESIIADYGKDFTILFYPDAGHDGGPYRGEVSKWILATLAG